MTLFSKIIAGEIPSYKILEDTYFYAFLDVFPLVEGHVLIVPKTETDHFFDLEDSYLQKILVFAKPIAKAIEKTFGKAPVPVRGGGSIPICSLFEEELNLKIVFLGFGLDSDNLHSPNEKYDIVNFYKGIETIPYFHQYFAALS